VDGRWVIRGGEAVARWYFVTFVGFEVMNRGCQSRADEEDAEDGETHGEKMDTKKEPKEEKRIEESFERVDQGRPGW
jgi:hypothetical protein